MYAVMLLPSSADKNCRIVRMYSVLYKRRVVEVTLLHRKYFCMEHTFPTKLRIPFSLTYTSYHPMLERSLLRTHDTIGSWRVINGMSLWCRFSEGETRHSVEYVRHVPLPLWWAKRDFLEWTIYYSVSNTPNTYSLAYLSLIGSRCSV